MLELDRTTSKAWHCSMPKSVWLPRKLLGAIQAKQGAWPIRGTQSNITLGLSRVVLPAAPIPHNTPWLCL